MSLFYLDESDEYGKPLAAMPKPLFPIYIGWQACVVVSQYPIFGGGGGASVINKSGDKDFVWACSQRAFCVRTLAFCFSIICFGSRYR